MAQAVIGGCAYWISPFRLRELRLAAPFIDQVSALARERARAGAGTLSTVQDASEAAYAMLCVLAVGIEGADADQLAAEASLEELSALRLAFDQVMAEAGLKPDPQSGGPQLGDAHLGEPQAAQAAGP